MEKEAHNCSEHSFTITTVIERIHFAILFSLSYERGADTYSCRLVSLCVCWMAGWMHGDVCEREKYVQFTVNDVRVYIITSTHRRRRRQALCVRNEYIAKQRKPQIERETDRIEWESNHSVRAAEHKNINIRRRWTEVVLNLICNVSSWELWFVHTFTLILSSSKLFFFRLVAVVIFEKLISTKLRTRKEKKINS